MVMYAVAALFLALSFVILLGKGDFLISGYNTASEEKKARYNLRRLRMSTGISIFVITAIFWLSLLLQLSETTMAIIVGVVALLVGIIQKFYVMK